MDVGEQQHAGDGEDQRERVAPGARAQRGHGDGPGELDRHGRAERQPVDRQVEGEVHQPEHAAERRDECEAARVPRAAPRPAPGDEGHGGADHAQPRDARRGHAIEEQDGERGAGVLRHGPADEQRLGREARACGR